MNLSNKKRALITAGVAVCLVLACILGFSALNQPNTSGATSNSETKQETSAPEQNQSQTEAKNETSEQQNNNNESELTQEAQETQNIAEPPVENNSTNTQNSKAETSSNNTELKQESKESNSITVKVTVTGSGYGNVSGEGTFTLAKDSTAYDALKACNLNINASNTQYGIYVSAIGGLAEKEHGASSGWLYSVNGVTPSTACSNYKLKDGDEVKWFYKGD